MWMCDAGLRVIPPRHTVWQGVSNVLLLALPYLYGSDVYPLVATHTELPLAMWQSFLST